MLKPMTCLKPEKGRLDAAEGLGNGYDELTVRVESLEGAHEVLLYCATKIDRSAVPYYWYKAFAVAGAKEHGLPRRTSPHWKQRRRRWTSMRTGPQRTPPC